MIRTDSINTDRINVGCYSRNSCAYVYGTLYASDRIVGGTTFLKDTYVCGTLYAREFTPVSTRVGSLTVTGQSQFSCHSTFNAAVYFNSDIYASKPFYIRGSNGSKSSMIVESTTTNSIYVKTPTTTASKSPFIFCIGSTFTSDCSPNVSGYRSVMYAGASAPTTLGTCHNNLFLVFNDAKALPSYAGMENYGITVIGPCVSTLPGDTYSYSNNGIVVCQNTNGTLPFCNHGFYFTTTQKNYPLLKIGGGSMTDPLSGARIWYTPTAKYATCVSMGTLETDSLVLKLNAKRVGIFNGSTNKYYQPIGVQINQSDLTITNKDATTTDYILTATEFEKLKRFLASYYY